MGTIVTSVRSSTFRARAAVFSFVPHRSSAMRSAVSGEMSHACCKEDESSVTRSIIIAVAAVRAAAAPRDTARALGRKSRHSQGHGVLNGLGELEVGARTAPSARHLSELGEDLFGRVVRGWQGPAAATRWGSSSGRTSSSAILRTPEGPASASGKRRVFAAGTAPGDATAIARRPPRVRVLS